MHLLPRAIAFILAMQLLQNKLILRRRRSLKRTIRQRKLQNLQFSLLKKVIAMSNSKLSVMMITHIVGMMEKLDCRKNLQIEIGSKMSLDSLYLLISFHNQNQNFSSKMLRIMCLLIQEVHQQEELCLVD